MSILGNQSFPSKLSDRRSLVGTWISLTDLVAAEIVRGSDLDFVIIDGEHAPMGPEMIHRLVGAARGSELSVLVRVPANEPIHFAYALDAGADGVLVPQVRSAEDVERAVTASRYPPVGNRGWGPRRPSGYGRYAQEYRSGANARTAVIVQVELREAIDDLDRILGVQGLDAILIGPNDLSGSLGYPGDPGNPVVLDAIRAVIETAVSRGIPAGIACAADAEDIRRWFSIGCRFVAADGDYVFLARAFDRLADIKHQLSPVSGKSKPANS